MHRIALLLEYPTLLGGERSLLAAIGTLKHAFRFTVFSPAAGPLAEALQEQRVELIPSPLIDASGERVPRSVAATKLVEAVHSCNADLLHGNSLAMGRLTGEVASRLSIPCTAHLRDIIGLSKAAIADLNGNARLIAVSEATRDFHIAQGLDSSRTVVIHNGIDLDRFRPRPRSPLVRNELGIPSNALVALTIGQIGLRKGWDVFAEAAATLSETWPALHVVLVGERYASKSETVEYERRVRERFHNALPVRAHFVGCRNDVPDLMNSADLLVHPARQEPFGRVLLEAAASGLPIVATDVGGTAEMLQDGITARLVPSGNPELLAQAMNELLRDANLRDRFARAARERVEATFSIDKAAAELGDVWQSVLVESIAS